MQDHVMDPIVEEVRRIRQEHAAQFNYDLDAIVADVRRSEAERDWPRAALSPRRVQRLVPATGSEDSAATSQS